MALKLFLFLIVFGLYGCTSYSFHPTEHNEYLKIKIIFNDNIGYDSEGRRVLGRVPYARKGYCLLMIPNITELMDSKNWCVWGHELGHCILGTFHDKNERGTC
ncbi:hypothetical protein KAR91_47650 [Candidatus Pacearchaeota archaeon]|nr:hypothetical protein [Candidatus Pacearchaeota archaeon]